MASLMKSGVMAKAEVPEKENKNPGGGETSTNQRFYTRSVARKRGSSSSQESEPQTSRKRIQNSALGQFSFSQNSDEFKNCEICFDPLGKVCFSNLSNLPIYIFNFFSQFTETPHLGMRSHVLQRMFQKLFD